MARRYTRDQAGAILRRAFQREAEEGDLTHEELLFAAKEAGLDAAAVERAALEIEREETRGTLQAAARKRRRKRFRLHLETYLLTNAVLVGLNFLIGGEFWVKWVLLGWGIGVAVNAVKTFLPNPEADEREMRRAERVIAREREQQERDARRDRKRARAREFKALFDDGFDLALSVAAQRVASARETRSDLPQGARVRVPDGDDSSHLDGACERAPARRHEPS
jgi:hypothetical protein